MGTDVFTTAASTYDVLRDEIGGKIVDYTITSNTACVAIEADLAKIDARHAEILRGIYAVADDATTVIVPVIVLHSGLDRIGSRSVSLKHMDEWSGPYETGGATPRLLQACTPLREAATDARFTLPHQWATNWRNRATAAAYQAA